MGIISNRLALEWTISQAVGTSMEDQLPGNKTMPKIQINDLDHYYEQVGEGASLVFIHGAFADSQIWEPQ